MEKLQTKFNETSISIKYGPIGSTLKLKRIQPKIETKLPPKSNYKSNLASYIQMIFQKEIDH
jgi:hypothetical protein